MTIAALTVQRRLLGLILADRNNDQRGTCFTHQIS